MHFTDEQLSLIAMALRQYSFHLSEGYPRGAASTLVIQLHESEQHNTWKLRDAIGRYFSKQNSSAN